MHFSSLTIAPLTINNRIYTLDDDYHDYLTIAVTSQHEYLLTLTSLM